MNRRIIKWNEKVITSDFSYDDTNKGFLIIIPDMKSLIQWIILLTLFSFTPLKTLRA